MEANFQWQLAALVAVLCVSVELDRLSDRQLDALFLVDMPLSWGLCDSQSARSAKEVNRPEGAEA